MAAVIYIFPAIMFLGALHQQAGKQPVTHIIILYILLLYILYR